MNNMDYLNSNMCIKIYFPQNLNNELMFTWSKVDFLQ